MCDTQDDVCVHVPDQWSPLNPEGKKRYERDFLMELQNDPQSKKKPENLPDIEVVLKDNTNRVSLSSHIMSFVVGFFRVYDAVGILRLHYIVSYI